MEKIKRGDAVAYIGTGSGHVPQFIEEQTGAKIFKFDLANLRTPDTKDNKFALANARHLPLADSSLDVVCLFDVLHHTKNQEQILSEARRVLRPGGKLLLLEDTLPEEINIASGVKKTKAKAKKWLVGKMDDLFNLQSKSVNPHNFIMRFLTGKLCFTKLA
ncbi:class I SAM-dependent methyltransferase [Patescibacteria group bacterium]|nr:MAG: class I SAM-dependent methyltransferase [Patescibacteria group bacterium]